MIANNQNFYQSTRPGEVSKDEIQYRGISQRGQAKEMCMSYFRP